MSADSSGKISLALGGARRISKPAPTNGVKRSHAALHDHEEDDEQGKAQVVSHFDQSAGGAIDQAKPRKEEKPLTIATQANRDWKEFSKRNKRQRFSNVAEEHQGQQNGHGGDAQGVKKEETAYGLNIRKKDAESEVVTNGDAEVELKQDDEDAPVKPRTDDERAIDALLGNEEKSELVLPAMTEDEAFDRDFRDAPDMASLADYEAVPVEQFGAAMLRGMGWKDGDGIGADSGKKTEKTTIPKRRPALLGIGAKEEAAVAQEMGTWGKAAKDRKGPQVVYNPVLLRDKKTGELFTEEELEKKKQREEREQYELEFEREERRKTKERRRRDDSRERDLDRKEADRKPEKRDDRDRRKRDDSDEEYYRRKEKERRRRERERDGSRDRSSRRHESDREKHRDSDRDRHRDSDRDKHRNGHRDKHRDRRRDRS